MTPSSPFTKEFGLDIQKEKSLKQEKTFISFQK